jgi:NAD(P)H-hydrate epimerase
MKLATAAEMQQLDRTAIEEHHIPGIVLMENAGRGTCEFMVEKLGPVAGKSAVFFIGPGNNGGDGLVIARHVHQSGGFPILVFLVHPDKLKGDAARNLRIAMDFDLPCRIISGQDDIHTVYQEVRASMSGRPLWSIVDALFGTGLQRPLAGAFLSAVNLINSLRDEFDIPVTAVDIPSGMNSDNGMPMGGCVRADLTATYGLAKPGHFMHGGGDLVGELRVVDIGIPPETVEKACLAGEALDSSILSLLAKRKAASHKGSYGHLLIVAGSEGKTGAAILSAVGALRIGTGLVTLAVPSGLNVIFESALAEAMTVPLPRSETHHCAADFDSIMDLLPGKNALIIGPGMGTHEKTRDLVARLYRNVNLPMVVDADALNILAGDPEIMADPPGPRILTPHPGEMSRLTGRTTKEIQADRLAAACRLTTEMNRAASNVTLVLKGSGTVISDPGATWAVNTTGNPGMAAGGMGDVLTGLIGGLLARGTAPSSAARLGVYIHGLSADRLAGKMRYGYLASEVAEGVPELITETAL